MSSRQVSDLEALVVYHEVSFDCLVVYATILENIVVQSSTCVRDVGFGFIIIPGNVKRVMVGPFCLISETIELCTIENT